MTRVIDAMREMGLTGETSSLGRWIRLPGERCLVYVLEAAWGEGYYTWCDAPDARTVELYRDPREAIQAGLRRAECGEGAEGLQPDGNGAQTGAAREAVAPERRTDRSISAFAGGER